jgi:hypothetical protein
MKVSHSRNTDHDRGENDRGKQHPDQFDEEIAERFELRTDVRIEVTDEDAGDNTYQDLNVKPGKRFSDL